MGDVNVPETIPSAIWSCWSERNADPRAEILRQDGSVVQPNSGPGAGYNQTGYDQNRVFRACQDAVVARVNQAGYQNARFGSTGIDNQRSGWVSGAVTATNALATDTFDFSCSMDFNAARVLNIQVNRR